MKPAFFYAVLNLESPVKLNVNSIEVVVACNLLACVSMVESALNLQILVEIVVCRQSVLACCALSTLVVAVNIPLSVNLKALGNRCSYSKIPAIGLVLANVLCKLVNALFLV